MTRQQARLIVDATESTARSIEHALPDVLLGVAQEQPELLAVTRIDESEVVGESETPANLTVDRIVEFDLDGQLWQVTVRSVQDLQSSKWLSRSFDKEGPGPFRIEVTLNTGHPFVRQFALGDRDSFEAVLRIAVALVVSESLVRDAGLEFASTMMRHIDTVLSQALSSRVGR